jgi:hypothetical protein
MFETLDQEFYEYDDANKQKEIDLITNDFKDFDY